MTPMTSLVADVYLTNIVCILSTQCNYEREILNKFFSDLFCFFFVFFFVF